jgi:uncharacterized protein YkwD
MRSRRLLPLGLSLLCASGALLAGVAPPDPSRPVPVPDAPPAPTADDDESCGLAPEAAALAELIRRHPLQQRVRLRCSGLLAHIAADKAAEMARRNQVTHDLGVVPPNRRLRKAGYRLPTRYPGMFSNQVETVGGGLPTPELALVAFLDSPGHRTHLLAEQAFYVEQDEIGVGYARNPDSSHIHYWVVYIARRADSGNPPIDSSTRRARPAGE